MQEENNFDYKSKTDGVFHGCGHDGHTTMLLGAAKYLAEHTELFAGTVNFIFQPAEGRFYLIDDLSDLIVDRKCWGC